MTCDAHFRTQPSSSSQKSCLKNWFGLVKPFKSYRVLGIRVALRRDYSLPSFTLK